MFGQISYTLVNDLRKTQFVINAEGVVSTLQKLDRENPVNKDMVLTVMALDGGGITALNVLCVVYDIEKNPQ